MKFHIAKISRGIHFSKYTQPKFPAIMTGKKTVDAEESQRSKSGNNKELLKGLRVVVLIGRLLGVFSRTDVLSEQGQKR